MPSLPPPHKMHGGFPRPVDKPVSQEGATPASGSTTLPEGVRQAHAVSTTLHKIPAAVNAWVAPTSDPIPPGPPQSELQYDMDPTEHKPTDETIISVRIKDPILMTRFRQGLCIRLHEVSNNNIGLVHCPGNTRSLYRGKLQYKPLESPIECIRAMMNYTSLVQTVSNDASAMALVRVAMD